MQKRFHYIIVTLFCLGILCFPITFSPKTIFVTTADIIPLDTSYNSIQDGRYLEKLLWTSPHGELPGTYKGYLAAHPLQPAQFTLLPTSSAVVDNSKSIALLVESQIYPTIQTYLQTYINDLEEEGYTVKLSKVSQGIPLEIKEWIKQQYTSDGISGVLFIGDIPAAWAEVSGSVFPCDLFYMDLDGLWKDDNGDSIYESHTSGSGDMGPEIYVARLYTSTLTYDTEAALINGYLAKTHAYRHGALVQPWRGLEYVDEDWYTMDVHLDTIYTENVTRYDHGYSTTASDYLEKLDLGQHFVQVCAHSYSGGSHFSQRPTEAVAYAHVYVYSPQTREAKLLLGSDDGMKLWFNGELLFTHLNYGIWKPDIWEVDVTMHQGWNRLLCKLSQEGDIYQFSLRFTDHEYQTLDDIAYQINNPELYGKDPVYIRSWLLHGFHQDTSENFYGYLTTNYLGVNEAQIAPLQGDINNGKTWTRYDSNSDYINLDRYAQNADFGASYAFARVYADEETSCHLRLGYDDGARVWLNGEEILFDNRYGGYESDMTTIDVHLQSGENRLLVKISEWMGSHGFSASFTTVDGQAIEDLRFEPTFQPIECIGTWLINGVYENDDRETRLEVDYLEGEAIVTPSMNESAPEGVWRKGIDDGAPFDLGVFFDEGDWLFSQTIQERDPPVLFYNLFCCGPGRFTDENYLAGSYIFNTTYGLITVASAKSGSMLNFQDFTLPLGQGRSMGEAFMAWFDKQAPYQLWEKEWYYGMVLLGDPTLTVYPPSTIPDILITKPEHALYVGDTRILPFFMPFIIGDFSVETSVLPTNTVFDTAEWYLDGKQVITDDDYPFSLMLDEKLFGLHNVRVIAHDYQGGTEEADIDILVCNLGLG